MKTEDLVVVTVYCLNLLSTMLSQNLHFEMSQCAV